jgi:hypothetical protein
MASQIASQLAKTFIAPSTLFFRKGERILSKPETATSLHSQEIIAVEEKVVDLMETRSIKFRPGETEGKGGGCSQRGPIKDIFALVVCSRSRLSCRKRSNADLHEQNSSREILERKYTIQRISREQERNGNYGQEDKRRDSKQNIFRNGQEVTKMVQSIQINPKIQQGLG